MMTQQWRVPAKNSNLRYITLHHISILLVPTTMMTQQSRVPAKNSNLRYITLHHSSILPTKDTANKGIVPGDVPRNLPYWTETI